MKPTSKQITYAVLLLASGGAFATQAVVARRSGEVPDVVDHEEGGVGVGSAFVDGKGPKGDPASTAAAGASDASRRSPAAGGPQGPKGDSRGGAVERRLDDDSYDAAEDGGRAAALEAALARIEQLSTLQSANLDDIARGWGEENASDEGEDAAKPAVDTTAEWKPELQLGPAEDEVAFDVLRAWADEHPLQGVLTSGDEALALVGGWVLRPGDLLPDGVGTLQAVEARALVLATHGRQLRVSLPPLRSRPFSGYGFDGPTGGTPELDPNLAATANSSSNNLASPSDAVPAN